MKILFITLGSGFKDCCEHFKFISEMRAVGISVDIYSVDAIPLRNLPSQKRKDVTRISQFIEKTSDVALIIQTMPNIKEYTSIILCDSIHFLKKSEASILFEKVLTEQFQQKPVYFHYISHHSANPVFNFNQYELNDLSLPSIEQLFNDPAIKEKVVAKYERAVELFKKNPTSQLVRVLSYNENMPSHPLKLFFGDAYYFVSDYLREKLSQHISEQISLKKIGLDLEPLKGASITTELPKNTVTVASASSASLSSDSTATPFKVTLNTFFSSNNPKESKQDEKESLVQKLPFLGNTSQ